MKLTKKIKRGTKQFGRSKYTVFTLVAKTSYSAHSQPKKVQPSNASNNIKSRVQNLGGTSKEVTPATQIFHCVVHSNTYKSKCQPVRLSVGTRKRSTAWNLFSWFSFRILFLSSTFLSLLIFPGEKKMSVGTRMTAQPSKWSYDVSIRSPSTCLKSLNPHDLYA